MEMIFQAEETLSRPGPSHQRRPPGIGHPQQSSRPQFSGEMFQTEGPPKRLPHHQQGPGRSLQVSKHKNVDLDLALFVKVARLSL